MSDSKKKCPFDREEVIRTARELFYLNGYKSTFLSHIAEQCGTSKQLLTYYFPSKANLANKVLLQIYDGIRRSAQEKMKFYFNGFDDLQVTTAVELKLNGRMRLHDENAKRFFCETTGILQFDDETINDDFSLYSVHDQKYHLDIDRSRDEMKMVARIGELAGTTLYYDYIHGVYNCTEQQLEDYGIEILFRLMNVDYARIEEINRMSNAILDLCHFQFKPFFVVL